MRSAGRSPSSDDRQSIERKRQRLSARIREFHRISQKLIGSTVQGYIGQPDVVEDDGYISDDVRRPEDVGLSPQLSEVENTIIVFPSAVVGNTSALVKDMRGRETRLRCAKANDALSRVRESLSGLSFQYINKIRQSSTSKEHLKAYQGIKLLSREVSFHQQVYNRNRLALAKLDPSLKNRYPPLRRQDCSINAAIADVNSPGQSQTRLSWFWGAVNGWEGEEAAERNSICDNDRLMECELEFSFFLYYFSFLLSPVYRVNWMRARAQRNRWDEELMKTEKEMLWVTLYFMHHRDLWYDRLVRL